MSGFLDAGLLSPVSAGTVAEAELADAAWLQAMLDAEVALACAQADIGVLPRAAADVIAKAAAAHDIDVRAVALSARETANPVVGLIKELTRVVGEIEPSAADYVHRGSTSQDIFDTGSMMVAKRVLELIAADLGYVGAALAELAVEHRGTVMAGRTLAVQAVPTTFGLKVSGWRELILEARARVLGVADALPVSLGGAAGTLAGYLAYAGPQGADPAAFVEKLTAAFARTTGLAVPGLPWHALRAPIADIGSIAAFVTGALGKFAVDVLTLSRTEIAEVAEPAPPGRGVSSAMPHKRNPVLATMIRSAALQVPALSVVLTQSLLSEDERSAGGWHAEWLVVRECLRLTGGAAQTAVELSRGLQVRADRMSENLALLGGQPSAERLSAALTPQLGKGPAKAVVTEVVDEAVARGLSLREASLARPEIIAWLSAVEIDELLDPATYTGAAGQLVAEAIAPRF
ncbi:nitrosuccinate lyase [Mycobacteroides immunogenum]|uniref:3-carboxy-cis,cis-muconate cycloisomerase n=1 Tax=Mycobacteroides immunogenum TaxID=83262 RepID=A0A7V8LQM1_9MYCO|nr:adenylosuccinate lyase family protein [Mycobacteroides immunogenum]AMT69300.1 3-carboxy-cis,cis-muconate cycloisomerase [Mycobacteroides immunogenum]ANO02337.1 3-carboxy-cis,cis-muconate cycloisomerase [Mycobacteroides immunogenum]KIU37625.1 3-carboxy-cis,cis-muconate cycloisomerase [Mycobacteroides immunogenum]KPG02625.1 3-carboxy-cis,cis-muconate cycloisomerase [Mycobacteroides immunogenum]KPG08452.1 3-carboxy-cis,cis-muconate cycloisomerase [Mycobacteroides immunogenum]